MKINVGLAAAMAVGATSVAVGALDAVPHMSGGYTEPQPDQVATRD
jgi:hypothetical protein